MVRSGQKTRILKWAGLVLSLLIFCLWVAPLRPWDWYYPRLFSSTGQGLSFPAPGPTVYRVFFFHGRLLFFYSEPYRGGSRLHMRINADRWTPVFWRAGNANLGRRWAVAVPLWMPFLLVSVPTAILWWRDRRHVPPGHCRKCGYNLTGNVSGICPECGEKIDAETAVTG